MIYKTLDTSIENALTTVLNTGIDQKERVHDVKKPWSVLHYLIKSICKKILFCFFV
jgi:hypothetical protein